MTFHELYGALTAILPDGFCLDISAWHNGPGESRANPIVLKCWISARSHSVEAANPTSLLEAVSAALNRPMKTEDVEIGEPPAPRRPPEGRVPEV